MSTGKVTAVVVAGVVALGIAVSGSSGGLRRVAKGNDILGGDGTTASPLTFTLHTGNGFHGTGSSGSGLSLIPEWDAGWFGIGVDGACNYDGSTVVAGVTPSANVYTLARDTYCDVTDIDGGITLNTGGYRHLSRTSLNNDGTISRAGNNATTATAGAGTSGAFMWGGAAGGAGHSGVGGSSGNSLPRRWKDHGGTGGQGGNSSQPCTGPTGGTLGTQMAASSGDFNLTYFASVAKTTNGTTSSSFTISAGGGGGCGAGNGSCLGTGGGGGGGAMVIAAPIFTGGGLITVKGGNGASCSTACGGGTVCGGGGGGMGGLLIAMYTYGSPPCGTGGMTCDVSGGAGGVAYVTGTDGAAGSAGMAWVYKVGAQ